MSTHRGVIEAIPEDKREKSLQKLNLNDFSLPQESALKHKWDVEGVYLTYSIDLQDKPMTKRGLLLSTTASLYDPLGLVAQELCRMSLE